MKYQNVYSSLIMLIQLIVLKLPSHNNVKPRLCLKIPKAMDKIIFKLMVIIKTI